MRVYPVAGRLVRDPHSFEPVPADGRDVADTDLHYARALADGDVTLTAPVPTSAALSRPRAPAASGTTADNKGRAA